MRDFSIIKQRLLQYLETKQISKYECYQKTGITNGVLSQKSGISEDNLLSFLSYYKDISITWLLTGEGDMLKNDSLIYIPPKKTSPKAPPEPTIIYRDNPEKDEIIQLQRRQIQLLEEKLEDFKKDHIGYVPIPPTTPVAAPASMSADPLVKVTDQPSTRPSKRP